MSMITNDWKDALSDEFKKDYYKKLYTFVKDEYSRCVVYPSASAHYLYFVSASRLMASSKSPPSSSASANTSVFSLSSVV